MLGVVKIDCFNTLAFVILAVKWGYHYHLYHCNKNKLPKGSSNDDDSLAEKEKRRKNLPFLLAQHKPSF